MVAFPTRSRAGDSSTLPRSGPFGELASQKDAKPLPFGDPQRGLPSSPVRRLLDSPPDAEIGTTPKGWKCRT